VPTNPKSEFIHRSFSVGGILNLPAVGRSEILNLKSEIV
jgi:hypothetical protein